MMVVWNACRDELESIAEQDKQAGAVQRKAGGLARRFWDEAQHEAAPAVGAVLGAGLAAHENVNPLAGSAAGYGTAAGLDLGIRALLK
jgi:hypothetical protein